LITTGCSGRLAGVPARPVVLTLEIFVTTARPETTSPNGVYLPFSDGYGATVMKNWLPALWGRLVFAIARIPARLNLNFGSNSSGIV
jgi:hypothetical protein